MGPGVSANENEERHFLAPDHTVALQEEYKQVLPACFGSPSLPSCF